MPHTLKLTMTEMVGPLAPAAFYSQRPLMQPQAQAPMQAQLPILGAMNRMAADIKSTLTTAIAEVCPDLHNFTTRMDAAAMASKKRDMAIMALQHDKDQHSVQLESIQLYVEGLDNRGRRHNRVPGVTETVLPE